MRKGTIGWRIAPIAALILGLSGHPGLAFDRPVVAVFGPTDPSLVGPYRRPESVVQPPEIQRHKNMHYRAHRDDQP